jgi:hypothetical protein
MSSQFLNHFASKNVALTRVVENVQADEPGVEVLVRRVFVLHRPGYHTS